MLRKYPTFDKIEDAEQNLRAREGWFRRFMVREPLGVYVVCYCYIAKDREGNTQWAYNEEFRFSCSDVLKYRDRAALDVGHGIVEQMYHA